MIVVDLVQQRCFVEDVRSQLRLRFHCHVSHFIIHILLNSLKG